MPPSVRAGFSASWRSGGRISASGRFGSLRLVECRIAGGDPRATHGKRFVELGSAGGITRRTRGSGIKSQEPAFVAKYAFQLAQVSIFFIIVIAFYPRKTAAAGIPTAPRGFRAASIVAALDLLGMEASGNHVTHWRAFPCSRVQRLIANFTMVRTAMPVGPLASHGLASSFQHVDAISR